MKQLMLILYLLSITLLAAAQQPSQQNWPGKLIEGTWIMSTKKGMVGETWKKVNEDHYQNKGFIINKKDTIITEQVALRKTADGIFYTSTVEGQNNKQPVSFKLSSINNNIFIFENPEHDFPKRIVYEFTGNKTLHAYIDEGSEGKKRQHFYYKKLE